MPLILRDEYFDESTLVKRLSHELRKGRLGIFIGAGLSAPFGLPLWDELLGRIYRSKRARPSTEDSLLKQAKAFQSRFYKNDPRGYRLAVKRALYPKDFRVSFEKLCANKTLAAIGSLVMASRRGSVSSVITLNFDNLLELYLRYHGFVTYSQVEFPSAITLADVTVLHAHGFIPFGNNDTSDRRIVFGEDDYREVIKDVEHPLSQELLVHLRRCFWLFLGTSGEDEHVGALLGRASPSHPMRSAGAPYWGVAFATKKPPTTIWADNSIHHFKVRNYHTHLPRILFRICQEAACSKH